MLEYVFFAAIIIAIIVFLLMNRKISTLSMERNRFKGALNSVELPVLLFNELDSCIFANQAARDSLDFAEKGKLDELTTRCEERAFKVINAGNKILKVKISICIDQQEQREKEEQYEASLKTARESHERDVKWITGIFDAINSPISVTDNEGRFTFINKAAQQIIGEERQAVIGKSCSRQREDIDKAKEGKDGSFERNYTGTYFSQFDGKYHVAVSPIFDESGMKSGQVEVVRSIIDSPNEDVGFGDKTYWLGNILDAVPLPISVTDAHGRWVYINKFAEEIFELDRSEAIGKYCRDWGSSICETENCGVKCLNEGKPSTTIEHNDKKYRIDTSYILDQKGRKIGYIELFMDKTAMYESQKDDTEFLDGLSQIIQSLLQTATGIDQGSAELAVNSAKQANEITALCTSISDVAAKTQGNTTLAGKSSELADSIKENAEKGTVKMVKLAQAVQEIDASIQSISKIFRFIDDIAFQTNILALNAAVEAARAGQHGRGFAVVAEEVRNLAAKSAASAKDTGTIITESIEKARMGVQIAAETSEAFMEIVSGIGQSRQIAKEILSSSKEQAKEIIKINGGIDQVTQGVQKNSAMAEESAAASTQMSRDIVSIREVVQTYTDSLDDFYNHNINEG